MEKRTAASERVGRNVRALRQEREQTLAQLSADLEDMSWPLSVGKLSKIERGDRGVDADDLEMLAAALGVQVSTLLLGDREGQKDRFTHLMRTLRELVNDRDKHLAEARWRNGRILEVRSAVQEMISASPSEVGSWLRHPQSAGLWMNSAPEMNEMMKTADEQGES